MLATASECTQCDPGYYCSETGITNVTGPCAPGYYCELGVNTPAPNNNNTGIGGRFTGVVHDVHHVKQNDISVYGFEYSYAEY